MLHSWKITKGPTCHIFRTHHESDFEVAMFLGSSWSILANDKTSLSPTIPFDVFLSFVWHA